MSLGVDTGLPVRLPFGIVPGDRHIVAIEWINAEDGEPIDLTGTVWAAECVDAFTGTAAYSYTTDVTDNVVTFTAAGTDTDGLSLLGRYEVRLRRTTPGPDTVIAGPVIFETYSTPKAA